MRAPFVWRDDGQGFDLDQPWRVHVLQQVPEGIEVIGNLGQKRLLDLDPDRAA
jgi:hypothetical protein